ncbi:MAG TPA: alpha/beta hydrolase-fold protein [Terriglobales bacterium]|nr:alpha/beta hydrolase-fold protein [Terriglobales bacterium]
MEEITHAPVERPGGNALTKASGVTGDLRLHQLPSKVFRNSRMIRVWLPPGYETPDNQSRRYPVLYLNDGQNLFDSATAFNGVDWQVGETTDRLIRQKAIPPIIVVGIDHAQNDRVKEYLPYRSLNPAVLLPQGKHYPVFLASEVMPFVSERYRIAGGPENTGLGGSSLGALISLYTAIERPGMLGRLLLESPSLFVSKGRILRCSRTLRDWPEKVFLAVGTREAGREDKDRQVVEAVRALERIIRGAGSDDERLLVRIDEGATHSERAWAARFPQALEFLFRNRSQEQTR